MIWLLLAHFTDTLIIIIADYGTKTCAGYPGSIKHIKTDAQVSIISPSAQSRHLYNGLKTFHVLALSIFMFSDRAVFVE